MSRKTFTILLLVLSVSCASQKRPRTDAPPISVERLKNIFDQMVGKVEGELKSTMKLGQERPLPSPFRVAVHFQQLDQKGWSWTAEDRRRVLSSFDRLKKDGQVSSVSELVIPLGKKAEDANLRTLAAQQGAHTLLVVTGMSEVDRDFNGLAATYVAIVPAFFVKGTDVNASFVAQALLWDVNDERLHLAAQAQDEVQGRRPAFNTRSGRFVRKAKSSAVDQLVGQLKEKLPEVRKL
jgi:hypothetical protein